MIDMKKIEGFSNRFLYTTSVSNYRELERIFDIKQLPRFSNICLFDVKYGKPFIYGKGTVKKSFNIDKKHSEKRLLHSLSDYLTGDHTVLLNTDKIKHPKNTHIHNVYALENIWLAYTYTSNGSDYQKNLNMCINTKMFQSVNRQSILNCKLHSLIEEE